MIIGKSKVFFHVLLCKKNGMAAMLLGVKFTKRGDLEGKLSSWTRYFFNAEARMGPMRITRLSRVRLLCVNSQHPSSKDRQ